MLFIGGWLYGCISGWPVWLGMIVCVLCGAIIGLLNGVLIGIMDLTPFLATLCTMMMTRGLGSIFSRVLEYLGLWWAAKAGGLEPSLN